MTAQQHIRMAIEATRNKGVTPVMAVVSRDVYSKLASELGPLTGGDPLGRLAVDGIDIEVADGLPPFTIAVAAKEPAPGEETESVETAAALAVVQPGPYDGRAELLAAIKEAGLTGEKLTQVSAAMTLLEEVLLGSDNGMPVSRHDVEAAKQVAFALCAVKPIPNLEKILEYSWQAKQIKARQARGEKISEGELADLMLKAYAEASRLRSQMPGAIGIQRKAAA